VPLLSFPVRRVLAGLRGGSSLPVIVDTDAGRFVTKLRGAAQGSSALAAEVIVAELAETLGLPVPERALMQLTAPIRSDDRNDELAALLMASIGENLGFRWLDQATVLTPTAAALVDDEFAVRVLWLDALVMNIDRTASNPNILISKGQPWLIDHGAALAFQYDWGRVTEDSPREPSDNHLHLFGARRQLLRAWDPQLASLLTRPVLTRIVAQVPDAFLEARPAEWSPERARAAYVAFLWKRLRSPRPFVGTD
jgi:hypothetical protein